MSLTISQFVNNLIDVRDFKYDRQYSRVAKLHKYWSRKPWFVIDQYIEKYSKEKHLILDPFCGSGIIGLQSLLAKREFIGYDLNPFAAFLAKNTLEIDFNEKSFNDDLIVLEKNIKDRIMKNYKINNKYVLYTILGSKNAKNYNAVIADENFLNKESVSLLSANLNPEIKFPKSLKYPDKDFPNKFYKDRFSYKGVIRVSDMFTKRNLLSLALLFNAINDLSLKNRDLITLAFTNTLLHVSKLKAENVRPLGVNNYWIPDDFIEENVWWRFKDRAENIKLAKQVILKKAQQHKISKHKSKIFNKSSLRMTEIKNKSVDYLITDPPYGDTIQYSELSFIWNCWLEKEFEIKEEVIINPVQNKGVEEYFSQLISFIDETKRVLKKNAYFTLAFHNKDLKIWISLAKLIRDRGMELVDISSFDTFGSPYNKNWAKFSPKSDFYVTFVNSQKNISKFKTKRIIYPYQIANEIISYLGTINGKLFSLNKAYDVFVGVIISKIFEGSQIAEYEKLSIENIINLFKEASGVMSKQVTNQRTLNLEYL